MTHGARISGIELLLGDKIGAGLENLAATQMLLDCLGVIQAGRSGYKLVEADAEIVRITFETVHLCQKLLVEKAKKMKRANGKDGMP